jgi:nicotinamidase-related amidase
MSAVNPANLTPAYGRIATIEARPQAVSLDTSACAVLVIDMQNDFGSKGGMFARAGIDISMIQRAVEPTCRVLATARRHAIPVIYLKMAFKPDLSDAGPTDSPNLIRHQLLGVGTEVPAPDGSTSRILVRDTWNTDIVDELAPAANDIVLYKHRFSGFFETELDSVLKRLGVRHLVVTVARPASASSRRFEMPCSATIFVSCSKTAPVSPSGTVCPGATMKRRYCRSRCCSDGCRRRNSS